MEQLEKSFNVELLPIRIPLDFTKIKKHYSQITILTLNKCVEHSSLEYSNSDGMEITYTVEICEQSALFLFLLLLCNCFVVHYCHRFIMGNCT